MRLGIDFGTTRTVVAAARDGRYPIVAFDSGDEFREYVPGTVARANGELLFGEQARASFAEAEAAVRSIKRTITGRSPHAAVPELGARGADALGVVTAYLDHLVDRLRHESNLDVEPDEPLEAMVSVPANANTAQRYLTLEAFRRAGFTVIGMLNEPTAAAIEFAHRHLSLDRRSPKRYVVVYDLGGGTFDTSAVSLRAQRFELLASEGISKLGGDDFDDVIAELALESVGLEPSDLPDAVRVRLAEQCRLAKEGLSSASKKLLVDLSDVAPDRDAVVLDAAELYARCRPLVDRTLVSLSEVFDKLREHDIDPENPRELGAVYVVGGGAAFPLVGRSLRAYYKRKVQLAAQPHAAVATGLAIAADEAAGVFVREAVTRHFGVWREAEHGRDKVFDPIFGKDSSPPEGEPLTVQRAYQPVHRVGHLRFLECTKLERGQPAGDVTPYQEILFPYDPELSGRSDLASAIHDESKGLTGQQIVETYTYRADGEVAVEIANETTGYRRNYVLGSL